MRHNDLVARFFTLWFRRVRFRHFLVDPGPGQNAVRGYLYLDRTRSVGLSGSGVRCAVSTRLAAIWCLSVLGEKEINNARGQ